MAEKQNEQRNEKKQPQRTVREVVVTHLDSPPPSGKRTIHPRRPAPTVPSREERIDEETAENPPSSHRD